MASTSPGKYPSQLAVMVTAETYDAVHRDALNAGESKGVVVRQYLADGMALAGHARDAGVTVAELFDLALVAAAGIVEADKATTRPATS